MGDMQLLIDLHKNAQRQGPGGEAETEKALDLAMLDRSSPLAIADIGCGTGASALVLARLLHARITAVDLLPDFLEILDERAERLGLSGAITTMACTMDKLPFGNEEYDCIWSEGAVYTIGFEKGIAAWRRFLKPGGVLVVSEITWITGTRPSEVQQYWDAEYPEIATASSKISILEKNGYAPIGYFVLPEHCWMANYYEPLERGFQDFLDRNGMSDKALALVAAEKREIELYKNYKQYYSYGVYIAKKVSV